MSRFSDFSPAFRPISIFASSSNGITWSAAARWVRIKRMIVLRTWPSSSRESKCLAAFSASQSCFIPDWSLSSSTWSRRDSSVLLAVTALLIQKDYTARLHLFVEAGNQTINGLFLVFPKGNGHTVSPPLNGCK